MKSLSQCARPYAKAAFEFAQAKQMLAQWQSVLQVLAEVIAQPNILHFVQNPTLEHAQVIQVLLDGLGDNVSEEVKHFLVMLGENDRLAALPQIYEWFQYYCRHADQVLPVVITSAQPLSSESQQQLLQTLTVRFKQTLLTEWKVDASLIGGTVIRAGDQVIDGSVRSKLSRLREALKG